MRPPAAILVCVLCLALCRPCAAAENVEAKNNSPSIKNAKTAGKNIKPPQIAESGDALMARERQQELKKAASQKAREKAEARAKKQKGKEREKPLKAERLGENGQGPAGVLTVPDAAKPAIEAWSGDFDGGKIQLRLWPDHFFLLTLSGAQHPRDITGLWRQSGDGVSLILYNAQDLQIKISRGKRRLYASFGDLGWGSGELLPLAGGAIPPFKAEGKLQGSLFTDAASGGNFPVRGQARQGLGKEPLFATVEIKNGQVERVLAHSRHFPRAFASMAGGQMARSGGFFELAANRHWLLPPMRGAEKAAIIFLMEKKPIAKSAEKAENSPKIMGGVEIGGPGLRAEGKFHVDGQKLAIKLDKASIENLEIIGASELAKAANGEFEWSAGPGFLNLRGNGGELRLVGE